mgnify:CR=1 FL=1
MKYLCYSFLLLITLASCSTKNNKASIYNFYTDNASVLINVSNLESLKSNINNNDFLQTVSSTSNYKNVQNKLAALDYLNTTNPIFISFAKNKKDSLQFTLATKHIPQLFNIDSLPNHKSETFQLGKYPAQKITYKNQSLYTLVKDSVALAASTKELLESLLVKKTEDDELEKVIGTINTNKPLSVIINSKNNKTIETIFLSDSLSFKNFTNYTSLDTEISQDQIILNGITKAIDSSQSLINVFKNTIPQENQIAQIAPNNCDGFLSFTFNDFAVLNENLLAFNKKDSTAIKTSLFDNIIEVGVIYEGNNTSIVLNSIDVINTKDALLSEQSIAETYRQIDIYNYSTPEFFNNTFSPFITSKDADFYCVIDQFFVFSNSIDALQNIIANYQNKTTLSEREYYTNIMEHLSDASSLLQVVNASSLKTILENNLNSDLKSSYKDYKSSAIQYIYDTDFAHVNAVIKKNKAKAVENSVTEVLNIKLDNAILNNPQFVTNHITKEKEIVVQDIKNKLYLISNTGNVLWKKQLSAAVLGTIEQIDVYKNGKLQLAFATSNKVYVLDRNGNDVDGYPLSFNDAITQPLSVFDYDKNKKYRLFVTQGKNVLLYDALGKPVKGFTFSSAKETINHQPQHIRIGNKDFIIIKTDAQLYILDRRGKTRVTPKTKLNYSNQAVYDYNNNFTTTTSVGKLVVIDQKGSVSTKSLNLGETPHLITSSKTLVAQSDNKLTIRNNTLELDFGNYSKPQLFYINNKIYVSVTDLQSQKVLLFDSQAKSIDNFPVYGNSSIVLDNIDKDSNLEFITKGENNSILVYEMN